MSYQHNYVLYVKNKTVHKTHVLFGTHFPKRHNLRELYKNTNFKYTNVYLYLPNACVLVFFVATV